MKDQDPFSHWDRTWRILLMFVVPLLVAALPIPLLHIAAPSQSAADLALVMGFGIVALFVFIYMIARFDDPLDDRYRIVRPPRLPITTGGADWSDQFRHR
jgi:hypothetical protein